MKIHMTVLMFLLTLPGCTSMVNVDFDESYDFQQLKSYTIKSLPAKTSDDPRIDSPLMQKRIISAIEHELAGKGFSKSDKADFIVEYRIDVKQELESDPSGVTFGFGFFGRHSAIGISHHFPDGEVRSYDVGILTIDILAAKDKTLVWRGSHSRRLIDGQTPEKSQAMVNAIVKEIFEKFPPGSSRARR